MVEYTNTPNSRSNVIEWLKAATGDTNGMFEVPNRAAILATVSFTGTFGGATAIIEISNDGTTFFPMNDSAGSAVSATADALFEVSTVARFIRPAISAGTGDSINVLISLVG